MIFKSKKQKQQEEYDRVAKRVMENTKHITGVMQGPAMSIDKILSMRRNQMIKQKKKKKEEDF